MSQLIIHQVLFTFKKGFGWTSKEALEAEKVTCNHINEIPEIYSWICGRSIIKRPQAVDFSLVGCFKSHSDLNAYLAHSDHQVGVKLWREISTWVVSDILIDA